METTSQGKGEGGTIYPVGDITKTQKYIKGKN